MKLRKYQTDAIDLLRLKFATGKNRLILCAATGAGKTVIFSQITKLTNDKGKKVLIATDRKELLTQTGNKLELFEIDYGIIKAGAKNIPEHLTVVCMLETLKIRLKQENYKQFIQNFDLIIIDEAHKNSFNKLFNSLLPNQKVIGATATPYRIGKMPELKEFYDDIVEVIKIGELISYGFLASPKTYAVPQDLSNIKLTAGDYDLNQMGEHYNKIDVYSGVYENFIKYCNNEKTLIFCATIQNSEKLTNDLYSKGLNVKHLDSYMADAQRDNILHWFYNTDNAILCNVGILTTGFDCPDVKNIILYRATKSLPLFLQMVGRGSRTTYTKKEFKILDFGNNILEHGFWEQDRIWKLENYKIPKKKKAGAPAVKECPACGCLINSNSKDCKHCGYKYPVNEKEKIMAILEELKPSQLKNYIDNCTVLELETIRELKNYKVGWLLHKLTSFNEFKEYEKIKGYKSGWAKFAYDRYIGG